MRSISFAKMQMYTFGTDIERKLATEASFFKMVFLGENPHNNKSIQNHVNGIVLALARDADYRVLAMESLYCLFPGLEKCSWAGSQHPLIDPSISSFNRNVDSQDRIIVTGIDIAHSIRHTPKLVFEFIDGLLDQIDNQSQIPGLKQMNQMLLKSESTIEKKSCIKQIKEGLPKVGNMPVVSELSFYCDLLLFSVGYVLSGDEPASLNLKNQRSEWFRKTIYRAVDRNSSHSSKIICYVGAPHAYKHYLNNDDYYVGETPEAQYFNTMDSKYQGHVYSVLLQPFGINNSAQRTASMLDPIENAVIAVCGAEKPVLVDLKEFSKRNSSIQRTQYYRNGLFQFDSVLYVPNEN